LANFTINLVKLGNPSLDEPKITDRLKEVFNAVITKGKVTAYQQTDVVWLQDCPASVADDQLLVYILKSRIDSLVSGYFKYNGPLDAGFTAWNNSVTSSEVFAASCTGNGPGVANMIFHESMHNKGHWTNAQLHPDGGLAADTVSDQTALTQKNIDRMARVLAARHSQWTGGCAYMNDPLRGASNEFFQNRPDGQAVADAGAAVRGGSFLPGPRGVA